MASALSMVSSSRIFIALAVWSMILCIVMIRRMAGKSNGQKRKYHPIGGTILNQLLNFGRLHHYMTDLASKHGTYRLLAPFHDEIYTSDPANVVYILKTNFDNFGKGKYNYSRLKDLLGDGVFAVDGDKWRKQRKLSSYEFSTKVLRDFSSVVFRKNARKLAQVVSQAATTGQTIDIQDLFLKSTMDSIFKVGFGIELDTLCGSDVEGTRFSRAVDNASALSLWRYVDIFWRIKKALNIGSEAQLKKNIKVIDDFVFKVIRNRTHQLQMSDDVTVVTNSSQVERKDLLSRFLQTSGKSPKYLRDIILNFLIAGKDTTAGTLSWFIYMLCKHPSIQEKLAIEIKEAVGPHEEDIVNNLDVFVSSVTDTALEKMQFLHAALTETLRLFPAVPVDGKICFSDDTLPDGYSVRKGHMVAFQPYAMGRMKSIWGDDAEEYRPERWLDENGIFQPESPFKFTAFQAGPRICLGKEFAYKQMKIFSAVLLCCFVFKLSDETKAVKYRTMLTLHIDNGLHVCASHRRGA